MRATITTDTTVAAGGTVTSGQQAGAVAAGAADTAVAADPDRHLPVGTGAPGVAPHPGHELLTRSPASTDERADLSAGATIATITATEGAITTETTGATITGPTGIAAHTTMTGSTEVPTHTTDTTTAAGATITAQTPGATIAAHIIEAHPTGAAFTADTSGAAHATGATQTTDAQHESGSTPGTTIATQATDEPVGASRAVERTQHPVQTSRTGRTDRTRAPGTAGATETQQADHITAGTPITTGHQRIDRGTTRATGTTITEQPTAHTTGATIATLDTATADTTIAEHARSATHTTSTTSNTGHTLSPGTTITEQKPAIAQIAEPPQRTEQRLVRPGEPIDPIADQLPPEQVHPRLVDQIQKLLITSNKVLRQGVQRQVQLLVIKRRHRQIELLKHVINEPRIGRTRVGEPPRPHLGRRSAIRQSRPEHRIEQILKIRRRRRRRTNPKRQKRRHHTRRTHHTPPHHAPTRRTNHVAAYLLALRSTHALAAVLTSHVLLAPGSACPQPEDADRLRSGGSYRRVARPATRNWREVSCRGKRAIEIALERQVAFTKLMKSITMDIESELNHRIANGNIDFSDRRHRRQRPIPRRNRSPTSF